MLLKWTHQFFEYQYLFLDKKSDFIGISKMHGINLAI